MMKAAFYTVKDRFLPRKKPLLRGLKAASDKLKSHK